MIEKLTPEILIYRYGLKFNSGYACHTNALLNGIRINLKELDNAPFPSIIEMQTPKGPHAYLLWNGVALNGGVTAYHGNYLDYTEDEIFTFGKDYTKIILTDALAAYFDSGGNPIMYDQKKDQLAYNREAIDLTFSGKTHAKAVACIVFGLKQLAS